MANLTQCLVSEAFTESHASDDNKQLPLAVTESCAMTSVATDPAPETRQSALQTTLNVASSAASLVLYPYVVASKAVVSATSMAVSAPIHLTYLVHAKITQIWEPRSQEQALNDKLDMKEERSSTSSNRSDNEMELMLIESKHVLTSKSTVYQLLSLPVRLVHTGVSTAVAIPTQLASYGSQTIYGAMSVSHHLATSVVMASTEAIANTSRSVTRRLSSNAVSTVSFTALFVSGAMKASINSVHYILPSSLSNIMWKSLNTSGRVSLDMMSYAVAVPSYRILTTILPGIKTLSTESNAIKETRTAGIMLVRILGPQNAFYVLKWIVETINSDETFDAIVLCRDILYESLQAENYRQAVISVRTSTSVNKIIHGLQEVVSVLPSLDELLDTAVLIKDVSNEAVEGLIHVLSRNDDGIVCSESIEDDMNVILDGVQVTNATLDGENENMVNPIFDTGIELVKSIGESEETSSFLNAFGDFLDVLVG
ncbi:hypothetical protein CCR75_001346 [Bremia lactucae]|uniref:Uncharacterized protein n=1 Tax=Bremia lactucae TaxID=4779 RepID=A0A976FFU5_BRELC|nr:hypothetical protein CCR75_001346 [Bremia lactucae]